MKCEKRRLIFCCYCILFALFLHIHSYHFFRNGLRWFEYKHRCSGFFSWLKMRLVSFPDLRRWLDHFDLVGWWWFFVTWETIPKREKKIPLWWNGFLSIICIICVVVFIGELTAVFFELYMMFRCINRG